jgi:hydroxymethylbilane synthase
VPYSNLASIVVAARDSTHSKLQVAEVLQELKAFHKGITFHPIFMKTAGDLDLLSSLKDKEKTNFFTKEVDDFLLRAGCDIAIHSAKDLPEPLCDGLAIIAITKGKDPSDALVFREGLDFETLPVGARIATSSKRREEAIMDLRQDFICTEVRGTIEQRLLQLDAGVCDAAVIAEAALIRLGFTHRKRMKLCAAAAPLQGQLAVIARAGDEKMASLFSCIDVRNQGLFDEKSSLSWHRSHSL